MFNPLPSDRATTLVVLLSDMDATVPAVDISTIGETQFLVSYSLDRTW
jgi:hypothetical protein